MRLTGKTHVSTLLHTVLPCRLNASFSSKAISSALVCGWPLTNVAATRALLRMCSKISQAEAKRRSAEITNKKHAITHGPSARKLGSWTPLTFQWFHLPWKPATPDDSSAASFGILSRMTWTPWTSSNVFFLRTRMPKHSALPRPQCGPFFMIGFFLSWKTSRINNGIPFWQLRRATAKQRRTRVLKANIYTSFSWKHCLMYLARRKHF